MPEVEADQTPESEPEPNPEARPNLTRAKRSRASAVAPQALALVLAAGVGGIAALGLGSTSAWIALPLLGTTIPLWPRLARSLSGKAAIAVARPTEAWSASRLKPGPRWAALALPTLACAALLMLAMRSGAPSLAHLLGLVISAAAAIGVWAWQFCRPETLGRRIGASAVAWSLGLCGNWAASAADCASAKALVARVSDAAYAGARAGAREGVKDALDDPTLQDALAQRITERLIASTPGFATIDGPDVSAALSARVVNAVIRAKRAADAGDRNAAVALEAAETSGRTDGLLAFLGREAEGAVPGAGDELVEMHKEIAAIAELAGDSDTALDSYHQVILRRPNDADTLARAGVLLLGAGGRTAEARHMFERARDAATLPEDQFWALIGLGGVAMRVDTLADAHRQLKVALQIATRMSDRDPSSANWKRNLAIAHLKIGTVQAEQGLGDQAIASFETSNAIRAALVAADPDNTMLLRDLSIGHAALGRARTDRGDIAGAMASLYEAFQVRERLSATDASTQSKRELASIQQDIGNAREAAGDFNSALMWYRSAANILRALRTLDPENVDWARDLSIAQNNTSDVLLLMGEVAPSLASAEEAMAITAQLVRRDPDNTQWQRDLAMCHYRVGDARMAMEEIPAALASFDAGLAIVERLATGDAANMSWKRDVFVGRGRVGDARSRADLPGAVASYESALQVADAMHAADPGNPEYERDRASSLRKIGLARGARGDFTGALASTQAEHTIRASMVARDPENLRWRRDLGLGEYTLALILIDLDRVDDARAHALEARRILTEVAAAAPANVEWRNDADAADALFNQLGPG